MRQKKKHPLLQRNHKPIPVAIGINHKLIPWKYISQVNVVLELSSTKKSTAFEVPTNKHKPNVSGDATLTVWLPSGKLTESVNSSGDKDGEVMLKNHSITLLDTITVSLKRSCKGLEQLPEAVLIGPATGSAGEQLAIVLSTRNKTVLIGENTAGYVTGNNGFLLPGRNNGIVIGESYTKDKSGKVYLDDVSPGIKVAGGDDFANLLHDKKVMAAINWLSAKR